MAKKNKRQAAASEAEFEAFLDAKNQEETPNTKRVPKAPVYLCKKCKKPVDIFTQDSDKHDCRKE